MLRNRQWEMAAAMPVATLAMLTVPETDAGLRPAPSRMLELVGPKPIPSAPSTSEAQNPARATSKSSSIDNRLHDRAGIEFHEVLRKRVRSMRGGLDAPHEAEGCLCKELAGQPARRETGRELP